MPHGAALTGVVFVLKTGLPWEYLPAEMRWGSGMTCWRRLRTWQQLGVSAALHRVLLKRLEAAGQLDWRQASLGSTSVSAKREFATGPDPTGRGRSGMKRHLVVDGRGTPLGVVLSGPTATTA